MKYVIYLRVSTDQQTNLSLMKKLRSEGDSFRDIAENMNFYKRFDRKGPWNHVSVHRVTKNNRPVS